MGYKKINLSFIVLLSIFVLGILFASSYSANKTKLVTLSLNQPQPSSTEIAQSMTEINGIKTVFIDNSSKLLTFRYDNSKLTLEQVKGKLQNQGILVENLHSIQIIPANKKQNIPKNKQLVELNFSSGKIDN